MTAAATANSTSWPPSRSVEIEPSREASMMPAIPAVSPVRTKASVLIRIRLTPARRAASALPPIA